MIHEGTYFSPRVQHAHLETHGSIAWMEDGRLHVRTSSQSPSICKVKLAHLFGLRPDQLRVFCNRVGGGFGGKQEVISEDLVALATLDTGRPGVLGIHPRRGVHHRFAAASDEGHRQARREGRRHTHGVPFPQRVQHRRLRQPRRRDTVRRRCGSDQYRCPNKKFDAYSVYTNTVPSGALRGYGMTQPTFAVESAMTELALALGHGSDGIAPPQHRFGPVTPCWRSVNTPRT